MVDGTSRTMNWGGVIASLAIILFVIVLSSWFFATVCIMAGALVVSGSRGQWRDWGLWAAMLLGFSSFAWLRAAMGPMVEEAPLFDYAIQMETLGGSFRRLYSYIYCG